MEEDLNQGFDKLAAEYDSTITFSELNMLQRNQVLAYIKRNVLHNKRLNILEINCGTGEDALFFGQLGHNVIATDASGEMIRIAKLKIDPAKNYSITFQRVSFSELSSCNKEQKFDLVFSNFGGLNSIPVDELKSLFADISKLLNQDGRFIGVVMPRFCIQEILYFFIKFNWTGMFRRNHRSFVMVNLNCTKVKTWYYSPSDIKKISICFRTKTILPIGIALPPTFLERFFRRKHFLLKILFYAEAIFNKIPILAGISDHFLFDLQRLN